MERLEDEMNELIEQKKMVVNLIFPLLRYLFPEITDIECKFDHWNENVIIGYLRIDSRTMKMSREKMKINVTADSNIALVNDILNGYRRKIYD